MGRAFDRGVRIGLGLVLGLLIVSVTIAYRNTRKLDDDVRWVAHTHNVLTRTSQVLLALVEAEADARRHIASGDRRRPQRYEAAVQRAGAQLEALKLLVRDYPEQHDRIERLSRLAQDHIGFQKEALALYQGGAPPAQVLTALDNGNTQMDAIRALVAELERRESALLAERELRSLTSFRLAVATMIVTTAMAFALVVAFTWTLQRSVTAQQRAAAAQAVLAAIVADSDDAIVGKALDGTITSWNRGAERLYGYSAKEIVGRNILTIVPPDRQDEEAQILAQLRSGARIEHYESKRLAKDGRLIDVSITASPIRDDTGRIVGASKIVRDITERRQAEEALRQSEQRYRSLFDNNLDPVFALDEQGRIVTANRAAERVSGYALVELHQEHFLRLCLPELRDEAAQAFRDGLCRQCRDIETAMFRKDGSRIDLFVTGAPVVVDEVVVGVACIARDITERRRADQALRESESRLRRQAEELREADRRKDEFLATLAHELRNPLAPIRNAVYLLKHLRPGDPALDKARDLIDRQVSHLVRLVDDLLDVGRITRGKLTLRKERVALADIVAAAVETSRPGLEAAGHELTVDVPSEPIFLDADPTRFAQVLSNLLNNAAKYTEPGGRVRLAAARRGADVVLSVRDTGVGIPPDMLPHVFDLFTQVDRSLERSQGGLGIGLTIVKSLVEMHGGRIEARSEGAGTGSEFIVHMPVATALPEPAATAAAPAAAPGRRILIVDDNHDGADTLAEMLRLNGYDVRTAYDGRAGLGAAETFRPHAILLDLGMPLLNGLATAQQVRSAGWGKDVLLIALTGWGQDADRQRTREAGFDYHLTKPVDIEELQRLLAGG